MQRPWGSNKEPSRNLDQEFLSKVGCSVETGTFYRAIERGRIENASVELIVLNPEKSYEQGSLWN